jgi:predicted DNA-binding helix-hairpin-helix protein
LYQADWLLRFYGFGVEELATDAAGNLDLVHDPKLAWALENRAMFPVDVNTADREALLRVPGLGVKSVDRILQVRRHRSLRMEDLARLRLSLAKIAPFVTALDHRPAQELDSARLSAKLAPKPKQLALL